MTFKPLPPPKRPKPRPDRPTPPTVATPQLMGYMTQEQVQAAYDQARARDAVAERTHAAHRLAERVQAAPGPTPPPPAPTPRATPRGPEKPAEARPPWRVGGLTVSTADLRESRERQAAERASVDRLIRWAERQTF